MPLVGNAVRCSILSLSGSGWLFPYHLGVIEILQQNGVLKRSTSIQGLSGGALVATGIIAGVSPDEMMHSAIKISTRLRGQSASHNTTKILRDVWGEIGGTLYEVCCYLSGGDGSWE